MIHTFLLVAAIGLSAGVANAQVVPRPGQQLANVPMEITGGPTEATSGALHRNVVVAQRQVAAREAVVLLEPARARSREIPAGTALARLDRVGADKPAWCDLRALSIFNSGIVDCLDDGDGDGRLDRVVYGIASTPTPMSITSVSGSDRLPASVAIRPARPEERPKAIIGYAYCKGDGGADPPRFAFAIKSGDSGFNTGSYACPFGVWTAGGDKTLNVDAIELKITPGEKPSYKLVRDYSAGPIGPVAPGESLAAATHTLTPEAKALAHRTAMHEAPLKPTGRAEPHAGAVSRGDVILSIPVTHGITGRLKTAVKPMGLFKSKVLLPAGQPVYGIPMSDDEIVWCAPRETTGKDRARSYSTCACRRAAASTAGSRSHSQCSSAGWYSTATPPARTRPRSSARRSTSACP